MDMQQLARALRLVADRVDAAAQLGGDLTSLIQTAGEVGGKDAKWRTAETIAYIFEQPQRVF